jgi:hypothetical protein
MPASSAPTLLVDGKHVPCSDAISALYEAASDMQRAGLLSDAKMASLFPTPPFYFDTGGATGDELA